MKKHVLHAKDLSVFVERDLGVVDLAALMRGSDEVLQPVLDPFDRPVELHCGPWNEQFLRIEHHDLRAEAAADERCDDAHLPFAQAQHGGKPIAQEDRRLRRVPYRQLCRTFVPLRDDAARFHRRRNTVLVSKAALDDVCGLGGGRGVVAVLLAHMRGDIAAQIVVHQRRTGLERFFEIDDGRQLLDLDGDIGECILGNVAAGGNDNGQRFADIAHLVLGETGVRAQIEHDAVDGRRRHQQRSRLPEVAEIERGIGGNDAVVSQRRRHIDRNQLAVRDRTAQQGGVEHARNFDVVDEQRLAGEELPVLVAADWSAEIAGFQGAHFAAHVRIRSAASSTASTMCW